MPHLRFCLALAAAACWAGGPCLGGEAMPPIDVVLAKWEAASQECRSLDAELTVFRYDVVFGDGRPEVLHGRLYFEAPDLGRYEIREKPGGATNDWGDVSEAMIWGKDAVFLVDGSRRECSKQSRAEVRSFVDDGAVEVLGGSSWLAGFFRRLATPLRGPQYALPLLVGVRAADVRKRFDLAIEFQGEDILIGATQKPRSEEFDFGRIEVLLDAKTFMVQAMQVTAPNGRDRVVYVLDNQKINQRPKDRDELVAPDLSGLRVLDGKMVP